MDSNTNREEVILTYKGKQVEVSPYFAYESSVPQKIDGKYSLDKSPIGHLIINFKVKLHLPAEQIPL